MKSLSLITEDAITLCGIVDLLEAGPATTGEIAMMQHLGTDSALRLCKKLKEAKIIDHPTATRIVLGVTQKVPRLVWQLTANYCQHGEDLPTAEELAWGI